MKKQQELQEILGEEELLPFKKLTQISQKRKNLNSAYTERIERLDEDYRAEAEGLELEYKARLREARARYDLKKDILNDQREKREGRFVNKETEKEKEVIDAYIKNPVKYHDLRKLVMGMACDGWTRYGGSDNYKQGIAYAKRIIGIQLAEDGRIDNALQFAAERREENKQIYKQAFRKLKKEENENTKRKLRKIARLSDCAQKEFSKIIERLNKEKKRAEDKVEEAIFNQQKRYTIDKALLRCLGINP